MSLRKGLAVFLLLTLGVSAFIISRSVDHYALYAFKNMDKMCVVYALLAVFAAWSCDAARFCLTARAMGYKIRFPRGLVLTWLHYFGCALTPMQVGGGPFQVYVLYRSGVPVGSGVAITLIRTLFSTFLLSVAAPTAFVLVPQLRRGGVLVKGVFCYVGFLSLLMWLIFILSIVKSRFIKKFCGGVLLLLERLRLLRRLRVRRVYHAVCTEVDSYSENVKRMVGPGLPYFAAAFALSVGHLVALFSVLPILMRSLGLAVNYLHVVLAQTMFMFILYFIPTPGASGVAEGGGAAIYGLLMPVNIAGIMAVVCRFFTEYLAIFMGCVVAIRMIGWGAAERIIGGKDGEVSEGEIEK